MGEAKEKEKEAAEAKARLAAGQVRLTPKQVVVANMVDLVCATLEVAARQLEANYAEPAVAVELAKSINHLQKTKMTYLGTPKVVLAPASALPKLT